MDGDTGGDPAGDGGGRSRVRNWRGLAGRRACARPTEAPLGCGSVIHGINFDYDSAVLRPESMPILEKLAEGLAGDPASTISIEGHTSSEGSEDYIHTLSERRAQAVVADLIERGIEAGKLSAVGHGEGRPIATNEDENGRSMNRRVEVRCGA